METRRTLARPPLLPVGQIPQNARLGQTESKVFQLANGVILQPKEASPPQDALRLIHRINDGVKDGSIPYGPLILDSIFIAFRAFATDNKVRSLLAEKAGPRDDIARVELEPLFVFNYYRKKESELFAASHLVASCLFHYSISFALSFWKGITFLDLRPPQEVEEALKRERQSFHDETTVANLRDGIDTLEAAFKGRSQISKLIAKLRQLTALLSNMGDLLLFSYDRSHLKPQDQLALLQRRCEAYIYFLSTFEGGERPKNERVREAWAIMQPAFHKWKDMLQRLNELLGEVQNEEFCLASLGLRAPEFRQIARNSQLLFLQLMQQCKKMDGVESSDAFFKDCFWAFKGGVHAGITTIVYEYNLIVYDLTLETVPDLLPHLKLAARAFLEGYPLVREAAAEASLGDSGSCLGRRVAPALARVMGAWEELYPRLQASYLALDEQRGEGHLTLFSHILSISSPLIGLGQSALLDQDQAIDEWSKNEEEESCNPIPGSAFSVFKLAGILEDSIFGIFFPLINRVVLKEGAKAEVVKRLNHAKKALKSPSRKSKVEENREQVRRAHPLKSEPERSDSNSLGVRKRVSRPSMMPAHSKNEVAAPSPDRIAASSGRRRRRKIKGNETSLLSTLDELLKSNRQLGIAVQGKFDEVLRERMLRMSKCDMEFALLSLFDIHYGGAACGAPRYDQARASLDAIRRLLESALLRALVLLPARCDQGHSIRQLFPANIERVPDLRHNLAPLYNALRQVAAHSGASNLEKALLPLGPLIAKMDLSNKLLHYRFVEESLKQPEYSQASSDFIRLLDSLTTVYRQNNSVLMGEIHKKLKNNYINAALSAIRGLNKWLLDLGPCEEFHLDFESSGLFDQEEGLTDPIPGAEERLRPVDEEIAGDNIRMLPARVTSPETARLALLYARRTIDLLDRGSVYESEEGESWRGKLFKGLLGDLADQLDQLLSLFELQKEEDLALHPLSSPIQGGVNGLLLVVRGVISCHLAHLAYLPLYDVSGRHILNCQMAEGSGSFLYCNTPLILNTHLRRAPQYMACNEKVKQVIERLPNLEKPHFGWLSNARRWLNRPNGGLKGKKGDRSPLLDLIHRLYKQGKKEMALFGEEEGWIHIKDRHNLEHEMCRQGRLALRAEMEVYLYQGIEVMLGVIGGGFPSEDIKNSL